MNETVGLVAPITAVTVFSDGARVVRTGILAAPVGESRILIGGLPDSADPASVRIAGRGQGVVLLDIEVRHGYGADPIREQAARLRAEAEARPAAVPAVHDAEAAGQAGV